MAERDAAFAEYYAARAEAMRGTAYLLCGDWHRAEDLVQTAFTKLYRVWDRVDRREALDGYLRRIIVRGYLDQWRRGFWRRERVSDALPDRAAPDRSHEDRLVLLGALAALPRQQRAVLVLRYWEDLPIDEVAQLLDCAPGTVKSHAARGLDRLRVLLAEAPTLTTTRRSE